MFLAAVLSVSAFGCAGFPRTVEKPTATVRGVALGSASLAGIRGEIALDVMNPNSFGVPLSAIDWELSVGGARAVSGRIESSNTIPAKDSVPVLGELSIGTRDAIDVGAALAAGNRGYTVRGTLHFSTSFGPIAVSFSFSGDLAELGSLARTSILPGAASDSHAGDSTDLPSTEQALRTRAGQGVFSLRG